MVLVYHELLWYTIGMKLTRRITILTVLIVVFAIVAPVILVFALGYRIDFGQRRLVATGTLFVKTLPKDANIFLNGELSETKTPVTFRLLLPGEYEVKIEKPGYQTWAKRFTIFPKRLTVAHDREPGITLLRSDISPELADASSKFLFKKNVELWDASSKDTVKLLQLENKRTISTQILSDATTTAQFYFDDPWLFIYTAAGLHAITLDSEATFSFSGLPAPTQIITLGNESFLIQNQGQLLALEGKTGTYTLVRDGIRGLSKARDGGYYVATESEILHFDAASSSQELIARNTDTFAEMQTVIMENTDYFMLGNNLVRVVDSSLEVLAENVVEATWDNSQKRLFYRTPNELWFFYPEKGESELITRTNAEITAATLASQIGYVFYALDKTVTAIEANPNFSRNTFAIVHSETPIRTIALDSEQMKLYYLTQEGLFSATIR